MAKSETENVNWKNDGDLESGDKLLCSREGAKTAIDEEDREIAFDEQDREISIDEKDSVIATDQEAVELGDEETD